MLFERSPELKRWFAENAAHGETERVRQLKRKWSYSRCSEYEHLEYDWWGRNAAATETISPKVLEDRGWETISETIPIARRRPSAPGRLGKLIVERFTGLVFSQSRRPRVSVERDPDTEEFVTAAVEQSKFWMRMREARTLGGAVGAVAASAHLRDGQFSIDIHPSWQCIPRFKDRRTQELRALLRQYTYIEEEEEVDDKTGAPTGRTVDREYLYRRYMDDRVDVLYKPWPLDLGPPPWQDEEGTEPGDPRSAFEGAVEHGLGRCPAVWVQNLSCTEHFDGDSDCEGAWQTFDAIDRLTSQANRSLLVNLDPTLFGTVDLAYLEQMGGTVRKGSDNAIFLPTGSSANYLEINATGVDAALKLADRFKQQGLDICRAVIVDPEKISGAAQSAKAIEYIYASMLEKADDLRDQYGCGLVQPLLELFVLIARKASAGTGELMPGVFDLPPRQDGSNHRLGPSERIALRWGPYFQATEQDAASSVQTSTLARQGELIDHETAVKRVAQYFGVEDVPAMMKKIAAEREAMMAEMMPPEPGMVEMPPVPDPTEGGAGPVALGEARSGTGVRVSGRMGDAEVENE